MKILFVADGRSPIAMNWISYLLDRGDEVHLATTFECAPSEKFTSINLIPVAFSQLKKTGTKNTNRASKGGFLWGSSLVKLRTSTRRILSPLSIPGSAKQLEGIVAEIKPDLVHALRIPFEGMLAAQAMKKNEAIPLIISVWGNDFTLHADTTPWMKRYTKHALTRADGLHADCHRDIRLAFRWGFSSGKPNLVVPGNGGIRTDLFHPSKDPPNNKEKNVINPRGVRSYIRNDTFFAAIPHILANHPGTKFICPGMAGEVEVQRWIEEYKIVKAVEVLPFQSRIEMAKLFQCTAIAVSPSTHDGTPNTLLEAMACGCYPVAGDLESIREWIEPEINGSLIDPADPLALAAAVSDALENSALRQKAAEINQGLIAERAEYQTAMRRALDFYNVVFEKGNEGDIASPS